MILMCFSIDSPDSLGRDLGLPQDLVLLLSPLGSGKPLEDARAFPSSLTLCALEGNAGN